MISADKSCINEAAFRKLQPHIDATYPKHRFVAIDQGHIVADAADINEMEHILQERGADCPNVLVVQAGHDYREVIDILPFEANAVTATDANAINQAAFRKLQTTINETYPPGHYVAIDGGQIVADAASFEELNQLLLQQGRNSRDILVAEAGGYYPEYVDLRFGIGR